MRHLIPALVVLLAAGCAPHPVVPLSGAALADGPYEAVIRRGPHGVAHITAASYAGIGFGEGYAQAEDHICTIADEVLYARGERALFHGRGEGDRHLMTDLGMRGLRILEGAAQTLASQPPEIRAQTEGFAAGFNRYLEKTGRDALPAWCRGAEWVRPISAVDVEARQRVVFLISTAFVGGMAAAVPPAHASAEAGEVFAADFPESPSNASNAWGIGSERSASGGAILLANPHYPWVGGLRFWEKQLVIPGELEVYGVSVIGIPGVLLGFNRQVAWSHTVSNGKRFTFYRVELVPGSPTLYRYGDEEREMTRVDAEVRVLGETEPVRRTFWFTRYGPVVALRGMEWTEMHAFTLRDANQENVEGARHSLAMGRARTLEEFQATFERHQGIPWVATVAAGAGGRVWFIDASATPNLSPEAISAWLERRQRDPLTRQVWQANGAVLLDGSDPLFTWVDDPEATRPGIVPPRGLPRLERRDYVFNSNDSFWIANLRHPLEGAYSPLLGGQRVPLSLRSRANLAHLENAAPYWPHGGRFTREEVRTAVLGNHSHAAHLLVPELVERCSAQPWGMVDGAEVELVEACRVLAAWDRRFDMESRGAALFREWLALFPSAAATAAGPLFAVPFDPADPLHTPRGLAAGEQVVSNLARAAAILRGAGHPLDISLGELQYAPSKLPERMPVHGGRHAEGVLNYQQRTTGPGWTLDPLQVAPDVPGSSTLTTTGYPVTHGTSFLMALEFTPEGPRAEAILTYGQSGDPASPHFRDQTEMFARKEWRPVRWRADEVESAAVRTYTVQGNR